MGRRRWYSFSSDSDYSDGPYPTRRKKRKQFLSGQPKYTKAIVSISLLAISCSAAVLIFRQVGLMSRSETMTCTGVSTGETSSGKYFNCDVPNGYTLQNGIGSVPIRLDKVKTEERSNTTFAFLVSLIGALVVVSIPGLFLAQRSKRKLKETLQVKKRSYESDDESEYSRNVPRYDSKRERRRGDRRGGDKRGDKRGDDRRSDRRRYRKYDYMSESDSEDYFSASTLGSDSDYYY